MGYIAVPQGNLVYRAANDYNRKEQQKMLWYLCRIDNMSPRAAIVLPSMNAENTEAVQKSLKWLVNPNEKCMISFMMPDGDEETNQSPA